MAFDNLKDKLGDIFKNLKKKGKNEFVLEV